MHLQDAAYGCHSAVDLFERPPPTTPPASGDSPQQGPSQLPSQCQCWVNPGKELENPRNRMESHLRFMSHKDPVLYHTCWTVILHLDVIYRWLELEHFTRKVFTTFWSWSFPFASICMFSLCTSGFRPFMTFQLHSFAWTLCKWNNGILQHVYGILASGVCIPDMDRVIWVIHKKPIGFTNLEFVHQSAVS